MERETPHEPAAATTAAATGEVKPNGPVAAVLLAAGIGALVLGILTTVAEASEGLKEFLEFSERVGPLSGKTVLTAVAFVLGWGGFHLALRDRDVRWRSLTIVFVALVAVGLVLTFPPFFQLFKSD
jgi:hypothetical protein